MLQLVRLAIKSFLVGFVILLSVTAQAQLLTAELGYTIDKSGSVSIKLVNYYRCGFDNIPNEQPALVVEVMAKGSKQPVMLKEVERVEAENNVSGSCKTGVDCLTKVTYEGKLKIRRAPGGYDIVWRKCCLGESFENYPELGNKGFALVSNISEFAFSEGNASPSFDSEPFAKFCSQEEVSSFTVVRDSLNSDSLVLKLSPIQSDVSLAFPAGRMITDFQHPDYVPVSPLEILDVLPGHSYQEPFGDAGELIIDQQASLIKLNVKTRGKYLVGFTIDEYRNDKKIGSTQRVSFIESN